MSTAIVLGKILLLSKSNIPPAILLQLFISVANLSFQRAQS